MPQTILAVLGMMITTLFCVNQQQVLLETRQAMIMDAYEVMASGVGLQAVEYIGTKSFDQATVGLGISASNPGLLTEIGGTGLTLTEAMPSGRRCPLSPADEGAAGYDECDDVSDYNAMQWEPVPFQVGGGTVRFEVSATVRYVDASHQPLAGGTSRNKEVVVSVREALAPGTRAFLRRPVQVSRVYSLP